MKTIMLEVDDRAGSDYQSLSAQGKLVFNEDVAMLLRNRVREERTGKLTKLLDEIKNDGLGDIHPDILVQLLTLEPLNG
jgi:hypothetical protein